MPERISLGKFESATELLENVDTVLVPVQISSRRIGMLSRFHEKNKKNLTSYGRKLIKKGVEAHKKNIQNSEKQEGLLRRLIDGPPVERPPHFFEQRLEQLCETRKSVNFLEEGKLEGINAAIDATSLDLFRARARSK